MNKWFSNKWFNKNEKKLETNEKIKDFILEYFSDPSKKVDNIYITDHYRINVCLRADAVTNIWQAEDLCKNLKQYTEEEISNREMEGGNRLVKVGNIAICLSQLFCIDGITIPTPKELCIFGLVFNRLMENAEPKFFEKISKERCREIIKLKSEWRI